MRRSTTQQPWRLTVLAACLAGCARRGLCAAAPAGGVRVRLRGREVLAAPGETLRSALLRRGLTPHNGRSKEVNCRGLGTCGTCAVRVCETSTAQLLPSTRTPRENLRLGLPPHRPPLAPQLRLACQCTVGAGGAAGPEPPVLVLVKHSGFWGSEVPPSDEAADAFAAPLGRLEFLLDRGATPAPAPSPAGDALEAGAAAEGESEGEGEGAAQAPSGRAEAPAEEEEAAAACESCHGSQMAHCPACDGRGRYEVVYKIPDLPAMPDGSRPLGRMEVGCSACHGRGTVICRACFAGDPYDLAAIRELMARKPD